MSGLSLLISQSSKGEFLGSFYGVVANLVDSDIVVNKFEISRAITFTFSLIHEFLWCSG